MTRAYDRFYRPFTGQVESDSTSSVIDTRYAFDVTVSWRTTSGTTSIFTYQISNDFDGVAASANPADASWSDWTAFGDSSLFGVNSLTSTFDPPLGYAWARLLRENRASSSSMDIDIHVLYR